MTVEVRYSRLRTEGEEIKTLSVDWFFLKFVHERQEKDGGKTQEREMENLQMASIWKQWHTMFWNKWDGEAADRRKRRSLVKRMLEMEGRPGSWEDWAWARRRPCSLQPPGSRIGSVMTTDLDFKGRNFWTFKQNYKETHNWAFMGYDIHCWKILMSY